MTTPHTDYLVALLEDDAHKLYDHAPCGYLTTDGDGTIRTANQTFLTLSGRGLDELAGRRRFADLLSVGGRIYHETHYAPMLQMTGRAREIALDVVRPDGQQVPVLVNAVAERGADGRVARICVAVFDATQRRSYERELLRAKERAEASEARARTLARTLQETLIPPAPPTIPQLDVAAAYRPAGDGTEVGGDFYDVFPVGGGAWVVTIGDVCGKGAAAAAITALARYTLRAVTMEDPSPAAALRRLNEVLLQSVSDRFCSAVVVRLEQRAGRWRATISSAGHPLPLLRRAGGDTDCVGQPGRLAGVLPEAQVSDAAVELAPGELLLLYTDGVPEARYGTGFYGDERMRGIVAGPARPAGDVVEELVTDVLRFQQGVARDDIAVVAVRAQ